MARVISDEHAALLRLALGLGNFDEIPKDVETRYWTFRTAADRLGLFLSERDILPIVCEIPRAVIADRPPKFLERAQNGEFGYDTDVYVKWKFGKFVPGKYRGCAGATDVLVLIEGDEGEDRRVSGDRVFLPEELPDKSKKAK